MILLSLLLHAVIATGRLSDVTKRQRSNVAEEDPFALISASTDLVWSPCNPNSSAGSISGVSCARLFTPLDYSNHSRGNVNLAILKLSGTDPTKDAVFFNPGGPGDDPVYFLLTNIELLRAEVGSDNDIIVIQPRAIGSTFPAITADASDQAAAYRTSQIHSNLPGYNEISLAETYAIGQNLGLDFALVSPEVSPYAGTVSNAFDLDFVRQVLGQEELSYLGNSYGSVLGGTYAALFPSRVGRMVLDGILDFNDWYSAIKDPALDIGDADQALNYFFQSCHDAGQQKCAIWSPTIEGIRDTVLQADEALLTKPLPIPGFGLLKWPTWRSGLYNALFLPELGFPLLPSIITEIINGTAGPAVQTYRTIVQTETASRLGVTPIDPDTGLSNGPSGAYIIACSDSGGIPEDLTPSQLTSLFKPYEETSSFFGGLSAQQPINCNGAKLSTKPTQYTTRFENITTSNPILFVGNTVDPTTPIRNAHRMSSVFQGSRVLTVNGTGHLSFNAAQDHSCTAGWMQRYFADGSLPPVGTVCQGNQRPFG